MGNRDTVSERFVLVQFSANDSGIRFLVLCAHYSARALTFARARVENPGQSEESKWTVPLIFVGALVSWLSWQKYILTSFLSYSITSTVSVRSYYSKACFRPI